MNLRENIKKELRLISEQPTPQWHEWRGLATLWLNPSGPQNCSSKWYA